MNFSIQEVSSNEIDNFNINETLYQVTFDAFAETFQDGQVEIEEMLKDLVERFTALMKEKDKICVTFSHNSFSYPVVIPFVYKADFTYDLIEAYFYNVRQSYKYSIISIADSLQAKVQIAKIPSGSGRRKMEEWEKKAKKDITLKKKIGMEMTISIQK